MLYFKCPTCRTYLANKQIPFEQELDKICNSDITEEKKEEVKREILDKLQVKRYCCRMRILTYSKLIDIVK